MNPIQVSMPSGEAREAKLRDAIEKDKQSRFTWAGNSSELPGDVQFRYQETFKERCNGIENPDVLGFHRPRSYPIGDLKVFNLELKAFTGKADDNSDLLASILNGHLYLQTLKLRKVGQPCSIVILGNEGDLKNACMKSAYHRGMKGEAATDLMITYENMVWDFEANCRGQNIGFWWLKSVPFKRILSGVHKILTEADLSRYAPKPVSGEEQAVALSILAGNGIGATKAKSILEKFQIILEPWCEDTFLTDCPGIGKELATRIARSENLGVDQMHVCRPQAKKPTKANKEVLCPEQ